jgi:predicted RNA-binding protein associated with RNAse of E/G family
VGDRSEKIYYRKEKLRGACWEYQIDGGWLRVPTVGGERLVLHHRFSFYRPREIAVRTCQGVELLARTGAEQWFFPDRWFSLLRFVTDDDRTVGYYVNFSLPLVELRQNYYRDLDLELDLWLDPDGTATELDRDEFDAEIAQARMEPGWVREVNKALASVSLAVDRVLAAYGPDLDTHRQANRGLPEFILRA